MQTTSDGLHVRVLGLQRSGNHAITAWIMAQFPGRTVCFLNNVAHGDVDLVESADYVENELGVVPDEQSEAAAHATYDLIVASFEDDEGKLRPGMTFLDSVESIDRAKQLADQLGPPARSVEIRILRDPYNFFASRIAKLEQLPGVKDPGVIKASWIRMARDFIADRESPVEGRRWVTFNDWFTSEEYRRPLSASLGGTFSDATLDHVSTAGGGSSFDGTEYGRRLDWQTVKRNWRKLFDPKRYLRLGEYVRRMLLPGGRSMKVLDRWEHMADDPRYLAVVADEELDELSRDIFGPMPGTEALRTR